jgi:hypothetical protein
MGSKQKLMTDMHNINVRILNASKHGSIFYACTSMIKREAHHPYLPALYEDLRERLK